MRRVGVFLVAMALTTAACGDDDATRSTGEVDADLVEGLTGQILSGGGGTENVPLTDEQAACFAVGLIDAFGSEKMVEAIDMEFEEFMGQASHDERMAVVDTMFDCVDFGEMMAAEFGDAVSEESARCVSTAFVDGEAFRNAVADSFGPGTGDPFQDPGVIAELLPAMLECFTAEELIRLGELDEQG